MLGKTSFKRPEVILTTQKKNLADTVWEKIQHPVIGREESKNRRGKMYCTSFNKATFIITKKMFECIAA